MPLAKRLEQLRRGVAAAFGVAEVVRTPILQTLSPCGRGWRACEPGEGSRRPLVCFMAFVPLTPDPSPTRGEGRSRSRSRQTSDSVHNPLQQETMMDGLSQLADGVSIAD